MSDLEHIKDLKATLRRDAMARREALPADASTETLNLTALLINQHRRIRFANRFPQITKKPNDLLWCLNISLEEDKSPWPLRADEFALGGCQFQSRYASDECARVHSRRLAR